MEFMEKTFRQSSKMVARLIQDEVVIVPVGGDLSRQGAIYNLESSAAMIWCMLDGKTSLSQIRDNIVAAMDVTPQTAEADLQEFIKDLESAGAIEEAQ